MRHKLTASQAKKLSQSPGRYGDGDGLWLYVKPSRSNTTQTVASWVFIYVRGGVRNEIGFGGYGDIAGKISLKMARSRADEARIILAEGGDPKSELSFRQKKEKTFTFEQCFDEYFETIQGTFKNQKHAAQWPSTVKGYGKPLLKMDIKHVDEVAIRKVLKPIWQTKPETASRLRGRLERVLDYATAMKRRFGDNPARLKGNLDHLLGKQISKKNNYKAMPYKEVPDFMRRLSTQSGFGARALELTILCATRTGETLQATWDEIDFEDEVWTIPAERMKMKREHRIPLTRPALQILKNMPLFANCDLIFPGRDYKRPMSNMTMLKILKSMDYDYTVHGFRSSFRDFAGDETSFAREIAETALAHVIGDATEQAYRRGDALERRRALMDAWASYLAGNDDQVIRLIK